MMDDGSLPTLWEINLGEFLISTDKQKIDIHVVHHYLAFESYWAQGIAREKVERFIRNSLCFGVYHPSSLVETQIGFARVITDCTTFAYLADVFILPAFQGRGLGKWLISTILDHPELQGLRKWTLDTRDAHDFYRQFGFQVNPKPEFHMILRQQKDTINGE